MQVPLTPTENSYHQMGHLGDIPMVYYTNSGTNAVPLKLNSITIPLGVGNGYFFDGDPVNGNGLPITTRFSAGLQADSYITSAISDNSITISNVENATGFGYPSRPFSGYPNTPPCQTFTFTGVVIPVNGTIGFCTVNKVSSSNLVSLESGSGTCLVWDRDRAFADVSPVQSGYIWRWDGTQWKLVKPLYRWNGSQWIAIELS